MRATSSEETTVAVPVTSYYPLQTNAGYSARQRVENIIKNDFFIFKFQTGSLFAFISLADLGIAVLYSDIYSKAKNVPLWYLRYKVAQIGPKIYRRL